MNEIDTLYKEYYNDDLDKYNENKNQTNLILNENKNLND